MPSSPAPLSPASASRAWAGLALLLVAGAALVSPLDSRSIDWQPALAWREPWRAVSAAWLHFSPLHLAANAAGALLVAALGWAGRVPPRIVVAWLVAWPLTQFGLLARPDLLHYGGLSGVLHAGVACVGLHLIVCASGQQRTIGAMTLVILIAKVLMEAPWGPALRRPPGWDIAVAPVAHASGLLAGLATAAVAEWLHRRRPKSALARGAPDRAA